MNRKITFLATLLFLGYVAGVKAQSCPPNIDFELGNYSYWSYYTGLYGGAMTTMTWTLGSGTSLAGAGRIGLTSGTGTDPCGYFPVVAPGGGNYSLKMGDQTTGTLSERATYTFTVPVTSGVWGVIYRYAVALQNPGHPPAAQPKMDVTAYTTSGGTTIPCTTYEYVSSSTVPGFSLSPSCGSTYTKPWTYGNMKFPGLGGTSVTLDFSVYDCSYGGHFGYCYLDMTCGFFANSIVGCATGSVILSGPDGFDTYQWYDSSTFSTTYGSSQVVSITAPTTTTTYALIITPYSGYGCPDTLYTEVVPSTLHIGPGTLARADSDTTICSGNSVPLGSHATSSAFPITYSWSPSTSLSCSTCANPTATPGVTTVYTVVVTDAASCTATGTVTVNVVPTPTTISGPTSICPLTTVNVTDAVSGGVWSCSPTTIGTISPTSGTIYGVSTGTFTITYTMGGMCTTYRTESVTVAPAAIAPVPAEVCTGQTLGMSDPTTGGTWSLNPAGSFASINSTSGLVTGLTPGTSSLPVITYTAPSGCFATAFLTVNPNPNPITGVFNVCQTGTSTVTDPTSPGGTWSITPTTVATVTPGPGVGGGVITGLTVGSAVVTYTLPTGCYTTANITVVPLPSAIVGPTSVCVGATGIVYTDPTPFGTWSISNPTAAYVDPALGTLYIYTTATTVDTIYYTSGSSFCAASLVVTINALPVISGTTGVCVNGTTTLSSTTSVTWSSSDTTKAKVSSSGVVTGISSGTVNITATNAAGCITVTPVVVNALPAAIAGPSSLCVGTTINLTDPSTGGSFSTVPGLVASVTPTGTVRGLTAGKEVITYTASSGCTITDTILVDSTPTSITGTLDVCPSSTTSLSDPVSGGSWSVSSTALGSISTSGIFTAGATSGVDTVTYSLGAGCLTKSPVTINPLPAPILPASPSVCVGGTTGLTDATLPGTWNASCAALTVGVGTGTVSGVSAGTCLVTYTASLTGCKTTKLVTVNPIPFGILPSSPTVCVGDTVTLTDATGGGTWSSTTTSVGSFAPLTDDLVGVSAGTTVIKYTVTSTNCATTTVATVNGLPSLFTVTGGGTFCAGNSAVVGLSGSTVGVTYQLMVGGVPTGSAKPGTGGAISFGPQTMAGIYTVSATNASGCLRNMTGSATIVVNPLPGPISGAAAVCVANTTTLTDPTGGGLWSSSIPSVATIGPTTGIVTGITQGLSTTITYKITSTGCLTTTTINVSPSPTAITGPSSVCVGACTTVSDTVTGGLWSSSSLSTATVGSSSGSVCGVSGGPVTITYSLGTGCTRTYPMTVTPAPLPITGFSSVCVGDCDTLTDLTPGGLWILNPASSGLGTLTTIPGINKGSFCAGTTAGVANISYGASGGTGCSVNYNVTINPMPAPITGNNQVCQLSCTTLTDTTTGGAWSISNIHGSVTATTGTTANFCGITTVSSAPTPATVKYTVAGCAALFPVSINPLPSVISGGTNVCQGSTLTLTSSPGTGTWSSSSGLLATVVAGPGASTTVTGGTSTGTATITYTLPTSCMMTTPITVNRTPGLISGPSTVCQGNSVVLNNPTAGGVWSSSNTAVATVTPGAGPTTVYGASVGTATISYTLGSCSVTYPFTVVAPPLPISVHSQVCVGGRWLYTDPSPGGTWTSSIPSVATISSGPGPTGGLLTGISSGTVIISYGTYGPSGCAVAATVVVNPIGPILPAYPSVCQGQTTDLHDTTLGGIWTASNTNALVDPYSGVVTGLLPGVDTISYNLLTGCSNTAYVTVNAVPGAISGAPQLCQGSTVVYGSLPIGGVWTSSVPAVGSIDPASGILTGVTPGLTTITYSAITTGTTACPLSLVVTVNSNPSNITGASSLCTGTSTLMTDGTPGGTWSSSNPSIASISATTGLLTASPTASGLVTVSYTLSGTSCYATKVVNVVSPPPAPTGTLSVCSGQVTSLSAPVGYTGTWSSSNTTIASVDMFGNVTGGAPGTAGITFTIGGGCASPAAIVTVNPLPAAILPYTGNVCVGSSLPFTDATGGGTWSSSNTAIGVIDPVSGIATGLATGVTVISYQLTATGCTNTALLNVSGSVLPITGPPSICLNATVLFTDGTSGGTWSSSLPGTASVDPLGNVTGVSAGTAVISYNTGGACTPTAVVVVNPLPGAITGNLNVCLGDSTLLSNSVGVGTWSLSNTTVATLGASYGEVVSVPTGATTAAYDTVIYSLGPGCNATAVVSVNPFPAGISGPNNVCQSQNITLSSATGGGIWSSANTAIGTVGSSSGTVTGTGIGNVNISYTNASGCSVLQNVTVNGMPSSITGDFNVCVTGSVTLHDTLSTGQWLSTNPSVATIGSASGVVNGLTVGTTTIINQNSLAPNCAVAQIITVYPLPTVYTVTGGGSHCADDSGVHIGLSGSESGVNYFVYLSGSSTAVGHVPGTGTALDLGLYTVAGTYTVTATSTSTGCGLPMNGSAVVHVIPTVNPSVSINESPGATVCAGTTVTFTSVPVNGGVSPGYIWSVNSYPVTTTPGYSYIPANNDTVEVTMTSSANCAVPLTVTRTVVMTVNPFANPTVNLDLTPGDTVCQGSAVTVRAITEYGGTAPSFTWVWNAVPQAGSTGSTFTLAPHNGDVVYAAMASNYPCRLSNSDSSAQVTLHTEEAVYPIVQINANPGTSVSPGDTVTFTAVLTNAVPSPSYQWYVNGVPVAGATTSKYTGSNFSATNEDSVSVAVTSSGICTITGHQWVYIRVHPEGVPTVTSSTGDISVVPNPNKGEFTVKGSLSANADEDVSLEITDVLGQVIYRNTVNAKNGKLNQQVKLAGSIANGMYILTLHSESDNMVFHLVIEQ